MTLPCILCAHPQPATGQTCDPCVGRVRRNLIRVEQLYALLPYELEGRAGASVPPDPSGVRGSRDHIPGGDILVLLGPGSVGWHSDPVDVDSVLGVLEKYDTGWRIAFREPAADTPATISRCALYLLQHLTKAAAEFDPGWFVEFADDMRRLGHQLETALRMGPQYSQVPCYCGGRLERPAPRDDGRAFEWQCGRCHRNYTLEEFWMAARQDEQAM